ncbi:MAG: chemotaxis protein CheB [Stellaceae bacterium]
MARAFAPRTRAAGAWLRHRRRRLASIGGFQALRTIVAALPADFAAAVFVVLHIGERPSRGTPGGRETGAAPARPLQRRCPLFALARR